MTIEVMQDFRILLSPNKRPEGVEGECGRPLIDSIFAATFGSTPDLLRDGSRRIGRTATCSKKGFNHCDHPVLLPG